MSAKKHLHRYEWLSFSENEQALLEAYLAKMQQAGYEAQKIARFYIRFKYKGKEAQIRPVHAYRRNYFSHLRWEMDTHHAYVPQSRSRFNALMVGICLIIFGWSLFWLRHLPSWIILRNVTWVGMLLLPVFALSFALDFGGRLHDSVMHEYQLDLHLVTPRLRAAMMSINMGLRYLLLFVLWFPTIVTELKIQVVFVVCLLGFCLLMRYYLPVRYRHVYDIISAVLSLLVCLVVNEINAQEQYDKAHMDFDSLATLKVHDLGIAADAFSGYKTMIHREASNSFLVPLTYRYTERRISLNDSSDQVWCQTILHRVENAEVKDYLMQAYLGAKTAEPMLLALAGEQVEMYVCTPQKILLASEDWLLYLEANTDLYPEHQALINEIIQAYL